MLEKLNPELCSGNFVNVGSQLVLYKFPYCIYYLYKLFIFLSISKWEGSLT